MHFLRLLSLVLLVGARLSLHGDFVLVRHHWVYELVSRGLLKQLGFHSLLLSLIYRRFEAAFFEVLGGVAKLLHAALHYCELL